MYRLYNPNTGEHLYTQSIAERNNLIDVGWDFEGVGWTAPKTGEPVYRLYNPYTSDHHYTRSRVEYESLQRAGWSGEGIKWYSGGSIAVYRQYNPFARTGSLVNGHEESQGNGSIMRFAPSYLIARALGRPEIVHEVSDVTHASATVREVCDRFAAVLDEHLAGTRTKTGPGAELKREQVNNSGWAVSTLDAALWAFNTTDNFADGLIAAVNLGVDSDSIGAVYGQLAGTFYGFDAIPDRWVKAVKTWEKVDSLIERFLDALEQ